MRIYKAKDYADMSRKAANIVSAQVIMKPNCVLGLATLPFRLLLERKSSLCQMPFQNFVNN